SLRPEEVQNELRALTPDLMVVVAYGLILPQAVLDIPRLGCVNVHASLLPRWRGAAPIQRAIEAGDAESGVCIMQMEAGLDTGPVLHEVRCAIADDDTGGRLHDKLAALGPPALLASLDALAAGRIQATPQDDALATYAHKLDKAEGALDWSRDAGQLVRQLRAFDPFPGCYADLDGRRIKLWSGTSAPGADAAPGTILSADRQGIRVACGKGSLILTELQLPNARRLPVADILNGHATLFAPGARFVSAH
ncbi:MAG TPA: methionyl-tRNA formyltransferase, partial [Spongiibacteraceae bacterium]|nr:methionyl-tRNA formyltransferase [Spongiibacteraceae bacterium]